MVAQASIVRHIHGSVFEVVMFPEAKTVHVEPSLARCSCGKPDGIAPLFVLHRRHAQHRAHVDPQEAQPAAVPYLRPPQRVTQQRLGNGQ